MIAYVVDNNGLNTGWSVRRLSQAKVLKFSVLVPSADY